MAIKKASAKVVNNPTDIPKGWSCLSAEKGGKFFLNAEDREGLIVLSLPDTSGEDRKLMMIVGTKDLIRSHLSFTMKDTAQRDGWLVKLSPTQNPGLISALYEQWEEVGSKGDTDVMDDEDGVIREVNELLVTCLSKGVSDLHLEVRKTECTIRMRHNGELTIWKTITPTQGFKYGRVIYQVLASEAGVTFNPKSPQDALVDRVFGGQRVRARVATAPASPEGFDMVMRLLVIQDSTKPLQLHQLGYQEKQIEMIKFGVSQPVGVVIVAGTTGSGKSTTLQNLLMQKISERNGKIKCITVEDPPEYFIPGATQIPVVRDASGDAAAAFGGAIRTAMRSDPDILMIGEIRDPQSANLLIGAVQSGHQVMSTIHAPSALGIIGRLENLGVERDTLGAPDFISALIYQKLLPKLCPDCSQSLVGGKIPNRFSTERIILMKKYATLDEIRDAKENIEEDSSLIRTLQDKGVLTSEQVDEIRKEYLQLNNTGDDEALLQRITSVVDLSSSNVKFRGEGCKTCKGSGITGRLVVSEVITPDLNILDYISKNQDGEMLIYWRKQMGGKFAIEDAIDKMAMGIIDPTDIEHELGPIGSSLV